MFALLLPVLFGLGAIVLDIGNWYVHNATCRRRWTPLFLRPVPDVRRMLPSAPAATNNLVKNEALKYAGDTFR